MAIRKIKKIFRNVKPYIKNIYNTGNPSGQFSFFKHGKKRYGFDFSATVPRQTFEDVGQHIKKHKFKYELLGTGGAGYLGASIGNRRKRNGKKKKS